jgi:DNA primase
MRPSALRFSPQLLDEIKARLPVSRVVERRVKLKRAGRELVGLSPFKAERTPSFTVNDRKGFYHCFASGEHGDIFTFLMKVEGLSFAESVERLAAEAGVPLPKTAVEDAASASNRERLLMLHEAAQGYFARVLWSDNGRDAMAYLKGRGLTPETIEAFGLGYALPDRQALKKALMAQGFSEAEIVEGGLAISGDGIATPYDRFRGRVTFPIGNRHGKVIAFGGRGLSPEQQPKYLNSPETPLFHKGSVLFNWHRARDAVRDGEPLIVVEGYMDVIALAGAGIRGAVAPLGTALTDVQLRLLWTADASPVLCFDGDGAGRRAAFRALETALPLVEPGKTLRFAFLPSGKDPDDVVRTQGRDTLLSCLRDAQPLFDVLWGHEAAQGSDTPELRAALEHRVMERITAIANATVRSHYAQTAKDRLWALTRQQRAKDGPRTAAGRSQGEPRKGATPGSGRFADRTHAQPAARVTKHLASPHAAREALLILALMRHPFLIDECFDDVAAIQFENETLSAIRNRLLAEPAGGEAGPATDACLRMFAPFESLVAHGSDKQFAPDASSADALTAFRHLLSLQHASSDLEAALAEAEADYIRDESEEAFGRLCALRQQMQLAIAAV